MIKIGKTYDFLMKPTFMRRWKVIRETKKGYILEKEGHGQNFLCKKFILKAFIKRPS